MKVHRAILKDKKGKCIKEIRYCNGILYRQNRSYDIEICFDDFIDRLKTTKKQAKAQGLKLTCDVIDKKELWEV